jgi:tRNA (guanosine-2'-O-)-methyltransferase
LAGLDPQGEEALIAHLRQFVTPARQALMERVLAERTAHIQVVLEDIYQPHNASAVMRSCECFGIQHLHVIENRYRYRPNREVSMGANKWIHLHRYREEQADNTARCIRRLRRDGLRIIATSPDAGSIRLEELDVSRPFSLWFGTEENGLGETALAAADEHLHIPMRGFTQSFNISVSAAVCLHALRAKLAASGADWRLRPAERRAVLRLWMRNSVRNARIIERAFIAACQPPTAPGNP